MSTFRVGTAIGEWTMNVISDCLCKRTNLYIKN